MTRPTNDRRWWRAVKGVIVFPPGTPPVVRFEASIEEGADGCWQWIGDSRASSSGAPYGRMYVKRHVTPMAHRWSYEFHRAPIPEGLEIDHLCKNTLCVNPWHLEPVTRLVNLRRGNSFSTRELWQTHCVNGHEFNDENTYWRPLRRGRPSRGCRTCKAAVIARRNVVLKEQRRAKRLAAMAEQPTLDLDVAA